MRFGLNLRGDLAKLSDSDISEQLDRMFAERQALYDSISPIAADEKWLYRRGLMFLFGREFFHSRVWYKLVGGYFGPFKNNPFGTLYRYDCEIKDILDEVQRRLDSKNARGK